jgi:TRAP-type C4-dicarboxylate transport system permease small subunit
MENVIISNPSQGSDASTAFALHHTAPDSPSARDRQHPIMTWAGRILSGSFALFLVGASVAPKLLQLPVAEQTMAELGWPAGYAFSIGVLELCCVVLYLIPRTSIFGAVITMGLLGGAMATQLRAQMPLFSHVLFTVYVGLFMWGGLWLRSPRLRKVFPFVRE